MDRKSVPERENEFGFDLFWLFQVKRGWEPKKTKDFVLDASILLLIIPVFRENNHCLLLFLFHVLLILLLKEQVANTR